MKNFSAILFLQIIVTFCNSCINSNSDRKFAKADEIKLYYQKNKERIHILANELCYFSHLKYISLNETGGITVLLEGDKEIYFDSLAAISTEQLPFNTHVANIIKKMYNMRITSVSKIEMGFIFGVDSLCTFIIKRNIKLSAKDSVSLYNNLIIKNRGGILDTNVLWHYFDRVW